MRKKLKICHLTSVHARNDIRIFKKECVSLAKEGYDVSFIVADGQTDEIESGVKIYGVHKENSRIKRFIKAPRNVYKKAVELNADLYHFHDPELLPIGNKLKRKGKIVIYDSHEDLPRQLMSKPYLPRFSRTILAYIFEKYEDRCCKKYDAIITATPFINKRFLKVNKKSINVNNYPFLNEFKTDGIDIEENKGNICYIGGITEIRGLTYVMKALENISTTLLLAGGITPLSYEKKLTAEKGWEKVRYYGHVSRDRLKEILSQSAAGIVTFLPYPNHINAQPNKLFEYMSSGIPVIASHYPLWKSIVEEYDTGICVDPQNCDEIAEAITFLIENPSEARAKGERGRNVIDEIFNWEQEEKKLIELYDKLQ